MAASKNRPSAKEGIEILKIHQLRRENVVILQEIKSLRAELSNRDNELCDLKGEVLSLQSQLKQQTSKAEEIATSHKKLEQICNDNTSNINLLLEQQTSIVNQCKETEQAQAKNDHQTAAAICRVQNRLDTLVVNRDAADKAQLRTLDGLHKVLDLKAGLGVVSELQDRVKRLQHIMGQPNGYSDSISHVTNTFDDISEADSSELDTVEVESRTDCHLLQTSVGVTGKTIEPICPRELRNQVGEYVVTTSANLPGKSTADENAHLRDTLPDENRVLSSMLVLGPYDPTKPCRGRSAAGNLHEKARRNVNVPSSTDLHHPTCRHRRDDHTSSIETNESPETFQVAKVVYRGTEHTLTPSALEKQAFLSVLGFSQQPQQSLLDYFTDVSSLTKVFQAHPEIEKIVLTRFLNGLHNVAQRCLLVQWLDSSDYTLSNTLDGIILLSSFQTKPYQPVSPTDQTSERAKSVHEANVESVKDREKRTRTDLQALKSGPNRTSDPVCTQGLTRSQTIKAGHSQGPNVVTRAASARMYGGKGSRTRPERSPILQNMRKVIGLPGGKAKHGYSKATEELSPPQCNGSDPRQSFEALLRKQNDPRTPVQQPIPRQVIAYGRFSRYDELSDDEISSDIQSPNQHQDTDAGRPLPTTCSIWAPRRQVDMPEREKQHQLISGLLISRTLHKSSTNSPLAKKYPKAPTRRTQVEGIDHTTATARSDHKRGIKRKRARSAFHNRP